MKTYYLVIIFILLISLNGCAGTRGDASLELSEEETGAFVKSALSVTDKLRFQDIPVPEGFNLIRDRSFVFQSEGTRVAFLTYSGRAKLQELIDFYKEQMLLYNWELLNVVEHDKSVLNFERRKESSIVSIESRGRKKIITISLAPKPKISTETQ